MGHTAFGLADEYPYYAGGAETGHDHHPAGEPSKPNVTANTTPSTDVTITTTAPTAVSGTVTTAYSAACATRLHQVAIMRPPYEPGAGRGTRLSPLPATGANPRGPTLCYMYRGVARFGRHPKRAQPSR